MGVATPILLFLSSAAIAGCFFWLQKHCASKIYQRIARPDWGAEDWHKYANFIQTEFGKFSKKSNRSYDDFGSGFDDIFKDFEDRARREYDSVFGEGEWDRAHRNSGHQQSSVSHTHSGRDPYKVFDVGKDATPDEIKARYLQLAKQHHPDKNPNNKKEAGEKFKELGAAYAELKRQGKAN